MEKLDRDQRYIVDMYIRYARFLKLAKNRYCNFPTPPLVVVEGDAGSGKSELIRILCQVMEHEFRERGDNPDQPYIIKGSFTGEAATNIKGMTLHTLFHLNFGNQLFKLSDKMKDKTRDQLGSLRLVIIDEYSMLSADMLYQINLRLQEITMRPDDLFGGVSVILLGNMLQLPPVNGRQIFEEPSWPDYRKSHIWQPLWEQFTPIKLRCNHR